MPSKPIPTIIGDLVRLNGRWSCQFVLFEGKLSCRWNSDKPPTHRQLALMSEQYWAAQGAFLKRVNEQLQSELLGISFRWGD
jgi:hypothetical protein